MSDQKTERVVAVLSSYDDANTLRRDLMAREDHLWVLVFSRPEGYEVSIMNAHMGECEPDVFQRCKSYADDFKASALQTAADEMMQGIVGEYKRLDIQPLDEDVFVLDDADVIEINDEQ